MEMFLLDSCILVSVVIVFAHKILLGLLCFGQLIDETAAKSTIQKHFLRLYSDLGRDVCVRKLPETGRGFKIFQLEHKILHPIRRNKLVCAQKKTARTIF